MQTVLWSLIYKFEKTILKIKTIKNLLSHDEILSFKSKQIESLNHEKSQIQIFGKKEQYLTKHQESFPNCNIYLLYNTNYDANCIII